MDYISLSCQACLFKCSRIHGFKKHFYEKQHRQNMKELFEDDSASGHGFFPYIAFIEPKMRNEGKCPRIGLSLVTLCFCPKTQTFFYLCHACEERCSSGWITQHISSSDHCSNYFNYIDPNVLRFSWMPSQSYYKGLHSAKIFREPELLQVLHLPFNLFRKLDRCTYSEVMSVLRENEKLHNLLQASKPQRTMIQAYQRDEHRANPLLGMQHIVECISAGPTEKRYYLCTLCKLPLAASKIIRHVLSFDHVYTYFKEWHPSTLMSKESYTPSHSFFSTMLAFGKQTEAIYGASNNEMKQISLEPAEFDSVNFTCYSEAFKKVEFITKEKNGGSLITSITLGSELSTSSQGAKHPPDCEQTDICTVVPNSEASLYKLCCQNCNKIFENKSEYVKHLSQLKHKKMLKKVFTRANSGYEQTEPYGPVDLGLFSFIQLIRKKNKLAVGVSLVVTCVSSQVWTDPIYICFACRDSFSGSQLHTHLESNKHLINTLLYLNPWLLPFGWKYYPYANDLWSMALQEEKKRAESQITLKVFDLPYQLLKSLTSLTYENVMGKLVLHHVCLKKGVPLCQTYSKLQQNERFPLLGKQFLVRHVNVDETMGFLCLLCEKRLVPDEHNSHIFSWEHVKTFLECFHPGSLTSDTDTATLLDLAKQAACIHPSSNMQEIVLDCPITEPCSYHTIKKILASVKERHGGGLLKPTITPKSKLLPRKRLEEQGTCNLSDNLQRDCRTLEVCENTISETSTDSSEETSETLSVKPSSEIVNNGSVKSEEGAEKEAHNTTGETLHCIKEEVMVEIKKEKEEEAVTVIKVEVKVENIEVPAMSETSSDIQGSSQGPDNVDGAEAEEEEERNKTLPTQSTSHMEEIHKTKRQNSVCENSQEGLGREMANKRQRLSFEVDAVDAESQKMPSTDETTNNSVAAANSSATTLLSTTSTNCVEPVYNCTATTSSAAATATCKAAHISPTGSTGVHKDAPVALHCESATQTAAPLAKMPVKPENGEASAQTVHMENVTSARADTALHIHTSHPAAPCPATATPAHMSPPTEPSHPSIMKTKPGENPVGVGFNQMIRVVCGERLQIYCMMCSVKLKCSSHRFSTSHQLKYVRKMFPGCRAEPGGSKWEKIIANLSEVERDLGTQNSQKIVVANGEYDELHSLPEETAIEKLKIMLSERELQMASGWTTGSLQPAITSPCEVSSPDDGTFMAQNTTPELSMNNQPEQENKQQETQLISTSGETGQADRAQSRTDRGPEANDLTPYQLQPCLSLKTEPDPIPTACIQDTAATIKQETADPDVESQSPSEVTSSLGSQNPGEEGLEVDPIMGLGFVWECRGMSGELFFLCESCKENNIDDCFEHMTSYSHRYNYTQWKHPLFLDSLQKEDLPSEFKKNTLRLIACSISQREFHSQTDVRIVQLNAEVYERVRGAPFSEAFEMLQKIERGKKLDISCEPTITTLQTSKSHQPKKQPKKQLNQEKAPSKHSLKTGPRNDHASKQETENHHLKKVTVAAGNLVGVNCEKVLLPQFVADVSSKADSIVSSLSGAGISRDSSKSLLTPPKVTPPVSAHQRPVPELQVTQPVLRSDSQPFHSARSKSTQSLSASANDERRLARKRPADTCVKRPSTSKSRVEDPSPVKRTCSSLPRRSSSKPEPACESPCVQTVNLNTAPVEVAMFDKLIALVKHIKSEKTTSPSNSPQDNANRTSSRANSSPKSGGGQWDSKSEQVKTKPKESKTRPLSKYEQIKAMLKNKPRFPTPSKSTFPEVPPAVLDDKNQQFTPNSNPSLSANNSFHEVQSTSGGDLSSATKATAVATMLPTVNAAEPATPIISGNVSVPQTHSVVTNRSTGRIPQSRGNTKANVRLLPIKPILTTRKPRGNRQQLVGDNKRQETGTQNAPTVSTVKSANQSKNPAALGWYDQNDQVSCVTTGPAVHQPEALPVNTQPTNNQLFTYQSDNAPGLYQTGTYSASRVSPGHINLGHVSPNQLHLQSFGYHLPAQVTPWFVLQIQQQQQQ